jgi:hypothetical protein
MRTRGTKKKKSSQKVSRPVAALVQGPGRRRSASSEGLFEVPAPLPLKKGERTDWHRNHELILYATAIYIKEHLRFPSARIVSEQTGLSREAVGKHWRTYDQERRKKKYQIALDLVVAKVVREYLKSGDARNAELLFKYVGNWRDPISLEHSGRVDFRSAMDKVDDSKDNAERVKAFVNVLQLQNDRRQLIGPN